MLGIESPLHAARDPLIGKLFENMVVIEALKSRLNAGKEPELYFYRNNQGNEVDLLFEQNRQLIPIEIRSAMTFNTEFVKGIMQFRKIASTAQKGNIVYAGDLTPELPHARVLRFTDVEKIFR